MSSHIDVSDIFVPTFDVANEAIKMAGSPCFVVSSRTIEERVVSILREFRGTAKFLYALKANFSPSIVNILIQNGVSGFDMVSKSECEFVVKRYSSLISKSIFTGCNCGIEEWIYAIQNKITPNLGSLFEIDELGQRMPGSQISIRFASNIIDGEKYVQTGGEDSKFGIKNAEIEDMDRLIKKHKLQVIGVHSHVASGIKNEKSIIDNIKFLFKFVHKYGASLKFLNFGGGFGVRYFLGQKSLDIKLIKDALDSEISKNNASHLDYFFELGKYFSSESVALLCTTSTIGYIGMQRCIGVNVGFNNLPRYAMYKASHQIFNISNSKDDALDYLVNGCICEPKDTFGINAIQRVRKSDILSFLSVGAYCFAQSGFYNMRPIAGQCILQNDGNLKLERGPISGIEIINALGFDQVYV